MLGVKQNRGFRPPSTTPVQRSGRSLTDLRPQHRPSSCYVVPDCVVTGGIAGWVVRGTKMTNGEIAAHLAEAYGTDVSKMIALRGCGTHFGAVRSTDGRYPRPVHAGVRPRDEQSMTHHLPCACARVPWRYFAPSAPARCRAGLAFCAGRVMFGDRRATIGRSEVRVKPIKSLLQGVGSWCRE